MNRIVGIIPAHMASRRFPGKPLATILGIPMIGHVYFRSKMCTLLDEVYVATCDKEIMDYTKQIGGQAIMTSSNHETASDRTSEALMRIEEQINGTIDMVVMIQGDEPTLEPEMLGELINTVQNRESILILNLMSRIRDHKEFQNADTVKVVLDKENNALYFSRAPVPSLWKYSGDIPMWKQLGLILFKRDILLRYSKMEPGRLELIESVDMNRLLENGIRIRMVPTDFETYAVDTRADLDRVEELLRDDPLVDKYMSLVR